MSSHYKTAGLLGSFFILSLCFGLLIQAWTGPTSAPPGGNLPRPINIGSDDQEKAGRISATEFYDADDPDYYVNPSGASKISGSVSIGGNLVDLTNSKTIYDASTGKISPLVMPYQKGDLTSDWSSNTVTSSYYDVSSLSAEKVLKDVSFGRGSSGNLEIGGTADESDVWAGKTFMAAGSLDIRTGTARQTLPHCEYGEVGDIWMRLSSASWEKRCELYTACSQTIANLRTIETTADGRVKCMDNQSGWGVPGYCDFCRHY